MDIVDKLYSVIVIDLNAEREWDDCNKCGDYRRLNHAIGYYCGFTHDPIGSVTTEYTTGGIVGGMLVCKECHDDFYSRRN